MLTKLKQKFQSEEKKRLLSNFFSLSILQGSSYILPLITFPYLVRVLGPEKFGLLGFAGATVAYFTLLISFGFNLSATRQISIHRGDKDKIGQIFSAIISIQLIFFLLSLALLSILIFSFEKFSQDWYVYYLIFASVLGTMMFPLWFYQGMERMKYITYLNLLSKLVYTVSIFIFIQQEDDFYFVPLISSLLAFITGLISIWIIYNTFQIRYRLPSISNLSYQLKEGWHIFISSVAINLYTTSTTFILGLFTNNTIVGYYTAGEKLVKAVQGLNQPISQTIYPYIAKLVHTSKEDGLLFIRKVFLFIGIGTFIASALLLIFADNIVGLVLGENYQHSIIVIQILSFSPFIIGLSNVLGIQTMLNYGMKKEFSKVLMMGSLINLILSVILVPMFQEAGSAVSVLIVEMFVTITMFIYLHKKGIRIMEGKIV